MTVLITSTAGGGATADVVSASLPDQLPLARLLALFLVPGALMTLVFVALAPIVETLGFPPILALLAAIMGVLVPFEVGVVLWAGLGASSRLSVITYRRP